MSEVVVVLVALMMLVCPVVMGAMMLMMWRGMRHSKEAPTQPKAPDT